MDLHVEQHITIHQLKIGGVTNSSVVQIGSAGIIKPLSNLYNTGGFTGPAPQIPAESPRLVFLPPPE